MNTQEKSLKLAELMGWETGFDELMGWQWNKGGVGECLRPYETDILGLSQFAAILLKFREVMLHFKWRYRPIVLDAESKVRAKKIWNMQPTQTNILNEILRMNNYEID